MKTNTRILAGLLTFLLLVSIFSFAAAQSERPSQPAQITTDLGTGFTYQGYLELDGQPVSGACDFQFSLWDAEMAGVQFGFVQDVLALPVSQGRFTALLNELNDFNSTISGSAAWLEISVRCPAGSGAYTTLSPRQALTAVPYALSLMPGAAIVGNDASEGLYVENSGQHGIYGKGAEQGVYGYSYYNIGVYGDGGSHGVYGIAYNGGGYGVQGEAFGSTGIGVYGLSSSQSTSVGVAGGSSTGAGGYFQSAAPCCDGAVVKVWNTSNGIGVWSAAGSNAGVYGQGGSGVVGEATANGGSGVVGRLGPSVTSGWAGQFLGNVDVTGTINGSASLTQIDHPLDPANRYLNQSAVVSPEMLVVVNGNAVTDENGFAIVHLPEWFTALAGDFRYQLTSIGQFAQAIVAAKVQDGQFTIQTDKPKVEVSWQVSGVRMDAYARQNPLVVEEAKPEELLGKYLHPELYGITPDLAIGYDFRQMQTGSPAMPHILEGVPQ